MAQGTNRQGAAVTTSPAWFDSSVSVGPNGYVVAPEYTATGLPGATAPSRYAGATSSGAPSAGTFAAGDFVVDQTGVIWICTAGGTPGTWGQSAAAATSFAPSGLTGATSASRYVGATASGAPTSGTFAVGDFVIDRTGTVWVCVTAGSPGSWKGPGGLISAQVLASPAASITISAIPQVYGVLRLLVVGASAAVAESDKWAVTVNGDTAAHYDLQEVTGSNVTAAAAPESAQVAWLAAVADMPAASATAGTAGILEIEIPRYAGTTLQKTGLWRSGYSDAATAAADQASNASVVAWRSAAAITSISVSAVSASNLVAGSAAYLYAS